MTRAELITAFRGLRVADVCDAMDYVGLFDRGLLDREIRPLYRDLDDFSHRIAGPALTTRCVPTNREVPNLPAEEFDAYVSQWYRDLAQETFTGAIEPGDVIVFDAAGLDVGAIGSNNTMSWMSKGAIGVVTNGGARDTDELIKQRCPVYSRYISRRFNPGRLEYAGHGMPVNCAGVLLRPGDMVVADGDGVIVVPIEKAEQVAEIARGILDGDKRGRRRLYGQLGLPPDSTVVD